MPEIDRNSASDSLSLLADTGAGGVAVAADNEREPYEALDDLMCVVEALCPRWPLRERFQGSEKFLL